MSEDKFTTGPWAVVDTPDYAEIHQGPTSGSTFARVESPIALVGRTANARLIAAAPCIARAGQQILDRMFSTYRARNGREIGIEGDDGEKCWIVHSDDIEELRAAIAKATGQ